MDKSRIVHVFVGLGLLACAICPLLEIAVHSPDCIFVTGNDTETAVALLLLIVELALTVSKLIVVLSPRMFMNLSAIYSRQLAVASFTSLAAPIDASPPSPLRI